VSVQENNKALVRRFNEEIYNRGNMDVADELLAPNFVSRDAITGEEAGREDLKREIAEQAAISSDLHFSIEEQIAEGDKVVTRIIGSGTHDLAEYRYRGSPPAGFA
jgi:ketosteroid isomerase-like protein